MVVQDETTSQRLDEGQTLPEAKVSVYSGADMDLDTITHLKGLIHVDHQTLSPSALSSSAPNLAERPDAPPSEVHEALKALPPEDLLLLPFFAGGSKEAKAEARKQLKGAEELVVQGGAEGVEAEGLRVQISKTLEPERVEDLLTTLQNQGRILQVNGFNEIRFVSSAHEALWSIEDSQRLSASNLEGPDQALIAPQLSRPWLTLDGEGNEPFVSNLKSSVLDTVYRNPGIPESALMEKYFFLSPQTFREVLQGLELERLVLVRGLSMPKCGLRSSITPKTWPLSSSPYLPIATGPQTSDPSQRYCFPSRCLRV
mmetsp:Transcript_12346/g.19466  ORF Transcript_12346/g.19466 Transcript_12346/m.19466 type:complete len:314 (-) Transcript_12346:46-987(-)